jgi:putative oxidoreductase
MGGKVLLLGRIVFSFFFIYSGFNHLTKLSMYSQYAGASGVPAPTLLTAISGLMLLAGGLSILLGVQARWGALLIAVFLVTAAFTVHKFWGIADPMQAGNQMANFWKNIALTGACLMIFGLTTLYPARWPYSLGRAATPPTL